MHGFDFVLTPSSAECALSYPLTVATCEVRVAVGVAVANSQSSHWSLHIKWRSLASALYNANWLSHCENMRELSTQNFGWVLHPQTAGAIASNMMHPGHSSDCSLSFLYSRFAMTRESASIWKDFGWSGNIIISGPASCCEVSSKSSRNQVPGKKVSSLRLRLKIKIGNICKYCFIYGYQNLPIWLETLGSLLTQKSPSTHKNSVLRWSHRSDIRLIRHMGVQNAWFHNLYLSNPIHLAKTWQVCEFLSLSSKCSRTFWTRCESTSHRKFYASDASDS